MGAVDDPTVISRVGICLCTKLEAEIFDDIYYFVSALITILYDDIREGGRLREWATLLRLTMTVLIPLPLPSTLDCSFSIL